MTLRVRFTPEAQADLVEARDWYDAATAGLGQDVLDEVEAAVRLAADWPRASPLVSDGTRRALVARFPYGLFYAVEGEAELIVLGCVHVRRHPRVWRGRLRPSD